MQKNNSVRGAIWLLIIAVYLIVSFTTKQWDRTWLIIVIGLPIFLLLDAFVFKRNDKTDI